MTRALQAAMAAIFLFASFAHAEEEKRPEPAKSLEELDRRLADEFKKSGIPGVSVTVIENNKIVLTKGYGVSDIETKAPVTPDTVFRAGSISKSWTAIAVMLLVEEGKLNLDAKLADLMPEMKFDNPWETTDPIRLVHLIEHTTGFDDIGFRHYLIEGKDIPLSDAVGLYGPYKSRWKPGTRMSYCNAGPVVAGRIIEKVTGKRFQDFIAERLTRPLGMESAYWTKEPQIAARIAKSYKDDGVTPEPFMDIPARPSGSLNVTSKDLARLPMLLLGRGTLDGVTYFKPETAERIEYPQTTNGVRAGLKFGYGLGVLAYPGKKAVFHGHDGGIDGFVSKYEYAPGKGAGFVVMANAPKDEAFALAEAIKDYLERDWPTPVVANVPVPAADLARWSGQYQTITPRQQILALITSLVQWQSASGDAGTFSFNDTKRTHLGGGVFQKPDAAAPNMVLVNEPQGVVMYTGTGANRLVPAWEMWAKVVYIGAFAAALAASVIFMLVWIPGAFRGRLAERGGLTIRLLPTLALLSIVALAGLAMTLMSIGDLEIVGKPSLAAQNTYALSLAIPVLAALAALRALMPAQGANRFVRGLAALTALLSIIAAIYLYQYGWIGLKTWE
ncbi:MAG: beta-lactamase family protein [Alphaproteobacteria bacterium]|nr:beta-lactamase family protein [Alphaproteobacteria bacterium]